MFGWFRKKKTPPRPADPLAAFDQLIEDLERQGAEVRRSAATLLALKGDLTRGEERYLKRLEELDKRRALAEERGDKQVSAVLLRDKAEAEKLLQSTRDSQARAEKDARLLLEAAADLGRRVTELKAERESASARLAMGGMVTQALKDQVERFDKLMALDAARDEVERAHALADIYREEQQGDSSG